MLDLAVLLTLAFAAFAAGVGAVSAFAVLRHSRVISRRLHDVLLHLDNVARLVHESDSSDHATETPRDIDALRVEVEWLVDTLTNEIARQEPR